MPFSYFAQQAVANRETTVVPIELDDVKDFHSLEFAEKIRKNVLRYIDIFYLTMDSSMPEPNVEVTSSALQMQCQQSHAMSCAAGTWS
jgi:hypothetical protein